MTNNKMGMKRIYLVAVNGDYQRYGWQQQHNVLCIDDIGYDMACELQNAGVDYDYNDVSGVYSVMDGGGKIIEQYLEIALVLTDEYDDEIARWDMDDQQFVAVQYITAASEYGLTEWKGEEYALLQDAYIDGTHEDPYYSATATDKKGNTYQIRWDIDPEYNPECGDESDACDWWNPTSAKLIDRAEW